MPGGLGVQGNLLSFTRWGLHGAIPEPQPGEGAGGEPQANQGRMGRTWCQEGPPGSATFSRDPHPEPPACRFRQPHAAPVELQGVPALVGREIWSCHQITSLVCPVSLPQPSLLTSCPLPSLPELLGSAKKVNVNFQDTDG